jgi:hypothetical protein
MELDEENQENSQEGKKQKKPYASPKLVEYGSVRKLTETTGTQAGDAGGGMMLS